MSASEQAFEPPLRYLPRADVVTAGGNIDAVRIVRDVLELHAIGQTTLPAEAYLGWTTSSGSFARSLALPGALWGRESAIGLKVINSSISNPDRGIPRAQGITLLFDRETARPVALMEAAHISALRTAAYTALSIDLLAARSADIAVIGCGALGEQHVRLLAERQPFSTFLLHDIDQKRCDDLVSQLLAAGISVKSVATAQSAVQQANVVITTTTVTAGYIEAGWLRAGTLIAHVSLDDVLPEVVEQADLLIVDDWGLVSNDNHRLLGKMYRAGRISGPGAGGAVPISGRRVDATLADIATGRHPGRGDDRQIILSNPFGMGILDIAIAAEIWKAARSANLGMELPV